MWLCFNTIAHTHTQACKQASTQVECTAPSSKAHHSYNDHNITTNFNCIALHSRHIYVIKFVQAQWTTIDRHNMEKKHKLG